MLPNDSCVPVAWTPELEAELRQFIRIEYLNSLRRMQLARCQGKEGFDSHALANAVARRPGHENVQVYHCKFCNRWHLGRSMYDAGGRRRNKTLIDRDRAREIEQELNGRGGRRDGGRRVITS